MYLPKTKSQSRLKIPNGDVHHTIFLGVLERVKNSCVVYDHTANEEAGAVRTLRCNKNPALQKPTGCRRNCASTSEYMIP